MKETNSKACNQTSRSGHQPLEEMLQDCDYVASRNKPSRTHYSYLYMCDLLAITDHLAKRSNGIVFDYGCGGSPYKDLFRHCKRYIRADISSGNQIDIQLNPDGSTGQPDESYDVVLSSQVLEHIENPEKYLEECFRILKPGGKFILTTHGMYEEHGCPYDFHRWTCLGLANAVSHAGLKVENTYKVTVALRAACQLLNTISLHWRYKENRPLGFLLWTTRQIYRLFCIPLLNTFATCLSHQQYTNPDYPSGLYIGVAVFASKPQ